MLDALPADIRRSTTGLLERVRVSVRQTIYEPGDTVGSVYLPIDAVISVVTVMRSGRQIEAFSVGREGMTGVHALFDGGIASQLTVVQVSGEAYRLTASAFLETCDRFPAFRELAERYLSAQMDAMAQSIACNRLHVVTERCARWLLTTHDRVGRWEFPMTHEALAAVLGVRRAGVSVSAAALQSARYINYVRGRFSIADRSGLETASCECYDVITAAFEKRRLLSA